MRYRRVRIHHQFLEDLFTIGRIINVQVVKGLPEDARFKYVITSPVVGIELIFESEKFAELKDGDEIPIHDEIIIEDLRPKLWSIMENIKEVKNQVDMAEDAYGGIVEPELWKRLGVSE